MGQHQEGDTLDVTFVVGDRRYVTRVGATQIVHEAFHAALPAELTVGHRLTFASESGDDLFADNFIGEIVARYGTATIITTVEPIPARTGRWRNVGFDHLAITVADRRAARDFFRDILQMQVMRDDEHLTVMATGPTALFLFDAGQEAPLSTGQPSTWHHLGFVVDDLEAAYAHLYAHRDRLVSDFTLLERDERWSLYCFYRNGDVTFMIQLSEIKAADRGITDPERRGFDRFLYDYASRPYGLQLGESATTDE
ncbi:MAG: VOC family protein [Chloroflexota bacterium]|nr:VOC family protein [Chloroflexota bacterium]